MVSSVPWIWFAAVPSEADHSEIRMLPIFCSRRRAPEAISQIGLVFRTGIVEIGDDEVHRSSLRIRFSSIGWERGRDIAQVSATGPPYEHTAGPEEPRNDEEHRDEGCDTLTAFLKDQGMEGLPVPWKKLLHVIPAPMGGSAEDVRNRAARGSCWRCVPLPNFRRNFGVNLR